jgi:hypothetical protein
MESLTHLEQQATVTYAGIILNIKEVLDELPGRYPAQPGPY